MDTWKATSKLTLTYGLRYELFAPLIDRNNETSNFTPANGGGIITAASNASGWFNRALIHPDLNNFAPRVGFAYQMMPRLVWRGGYGVFYQHVNRIGSEALLQLNPPQFVDTQLVYRRQQRRLSVEGWVPCLDYRCNCPTFVSTPNPRAGSEPANAVRRTDELRIGISS